jgi:hypothetical protein
MILVGAIDNDTIWVLVRDQECLEPRSSRLEHDRNMRQSKNERQVSTTDACSSDLSINSKVTEC